MTHGIAAVIVDGWCFFWSMCIFHRVKVSKGPEFRWGSKGDPLPSAKTRGRYTIQKRAWTKAFSLKNIKFNLVIKVVGYFLFPHAHPHIINHHKYCPRISLFLFLLWFTKRAHTVDWYIWFPKDTMKNACGRLQGEDQSRCAKKKAVVKSSIETFRNYLQMDQSTKELQVFRDTTPIHRRMIWYRGHHVVSTLWKTAWETIYKQLWNKKNQCKPITGGNLPTLHFGNHLSVITFHRSHQ